MTTSFNIILPTKIFNNLAKEQPEEQAAYTKGRGTRDMLVCSQVLIEKVVTVDQQALIMLKAFDSVCHSQLFVAFLEKGFQKH